VDTGHNFRTSAEFEIVRTIKKKSCYLAVNPQKEEQMEIDRSSTDEVGLPFSQKKINNLRIYLFFIVGSCFVEVVLFTSITIQR
jgi:hypothetical protein